MEKFDIYSDIRSRTGGDIYVGVVGPVRAGKSTFITNFMEKLVVPKVENKHVLERMKDELPQSANGKTIMTTQPKFVPNEAVSVSIADDVDVKVRLVDCVGYMVDGANGHMDGEKPRMVKTPWSEEEISFVDAADIGTRKVISDHSTIGVVMTTDGSIATELPRAAYVAAEERAINELKELGKPFIIVLNSTVPKSKETVKLALQLEEKYATPVMPLDVLNLTADDITQMFERVLMEFPLMDIEVKISKWLQALPLEDGIIRSLVDNLLASSETMKRMADYKQPEALFEDSDSFLQPQVENVELDKGKVTYMVNARPELFYKALGEQCGMDIADDFALMAQMKSLAVAKREYDKLAEALEQVKETGYGVVTPTMDDMTLEEPQMVKQGSRFGVRLRASAPSLHIMRVDIQTEVNPVVGTEQQSEELVKYLLSEFENDPKGIWETNMFGKSLHMLVKEGLNNKLTSMPDETQKKMRKTLSRIVNEGKGGIICILL
ncbi:stage IV sporulation protein A [Pumilibacter intestinalis]|jgi:stage IV sporulation protein A|uniref:stage IV sporulation protein A n=1 Tax=Pumilibacter intestinalis TaxID=2941511 RepID=UPI002041EF4A|nr:stage IV sporulation protein A [Pumilibacter intestinalis]